MAPTSFPDASFLASATGPQDYPKHRRVEIALVGRSNVGKSSFVNAVANKRGLAYVSKAPGRTQTINFIALDERLCLVDLPGYGFAKVPKGLKAAWGAMIERYLAERGETLRGVVHLVDGRHGPTSDDLAMREWIANSGLLSLTLATKWDKLKRSERDRRLRELIERLGGSERDVVPFSAQTGEGKDRVMTFLNALTG